MLLFLLLLLLHVLYHVLIQGAKRPFVTTYKVHIAKTATEATEAAASKSVWAIHSIYEKLSNELPTYQIPPNESPSFGD